MAAKKKPAKAKGKNPFAAFLKKKGAGKVKGKKPAKKK